MHPPKKKKYSSNKHQTEHVHVTMASVCIRWWTFEQEEEQRSQDEIAVLHNAEG
ncbi:unnamed protein product [Staurois parvus]|uniref:Uncharacterized protein n=1 Tax=Staurois parvus TaxID=386267 RepID=A0ABN9ESM1_9NEOB|nr:unnamed protein product [Staurois parvus]